MVRWYDIFEPQVATWEADRELSKLISGLEARDLEVRCLSYDALGRLGLNEGCKAIFQVLPQESSTWVRARAAVALGRLGGEEAIEVLKKLISDPDTEVRTLATRALGQQQQKEMMQLFCSLLDDEQETVVIQAIYALSQLGNHRAVTSLHRLFDHYGQAVRDIAASAINAINLNKPMQWPDEEVYFFTYTYKSRLICECYSYKLVAWRNYLRRRWRHPFARDWGIGYWEMPSLSQQLTDKVMRPGFQLQLCDCRA
jgi:hypothetical protein